MYVHGALPSLDHHFKADACASRIEKREWIGVRQTKQRRPWTKVCQYYCTLHRSKKMLQRSLTRWKTRGFRQAWRAWIVEWVKLGSQSGEIRVQVKTWMSGANPLSKSPGQWGDCRTVPFRSVEVPEASCVLPTTKSSFLEIFPSSSSSSQNHHLSYMSEISVLECPMFICLMWSLKLDILCMRVRATSQVIMRCALSLA